MSLSFPTTERPHTSEEVRAKVLTSSAGYRQADGKDGMWNHSNTLQAPSRTWLSQAGGGRDRLPGQQGQLKIMTAAPEGWLPGLPLRGSTY